MSEFIHLLKKRMEERGFSVDDRQLTRFDIYYRELKDWNTRINLTSLTDDLDVIDKHFIDSLLLICYNSPGYGIKMADVGTGAGFPGLPIKIYRPEVRLSLLESIGKKIGFLKQLIVKLGLENVDIINDRAEIAARSPQHREQYDLVVARCVARLPTLAEYCLPLVSLGGMFVAYKGHEAETEIKEARIAIGKLGGRLERLEQDESVCNLEGALLREEGFESDYTGKRALIFIEKVRKTPEQYPRRPGIPRKRPL